jgi:CRISPR-associated endonuclease Csy4
VENKMNHYQEITLIPDAETNLGFLWEKVYQQTHLALVENKNITGGSDVGVSFPQYGDKNFPAGTKLRLFAKTVTQLQQLNIQKWLNRLTDYTHITSIKDVPTSGTQFAIFRRRQFMTNPYRLAKRRAKRKGESIEQALEHYSNFNDKETKLPYINMVSLSSEDKNRFRLFIEREIVENSSEAVFSCYGLSSRDKAKQASVPWF